MKKATAVLLVLAMVLSFGSVAALATDAAALPEPADGVITLTENVTLPAAAVFGEGDRVTLDLNGYTLRGPEGGVCVVLEKGANLTVKDGSEAQSGAILASGEGSTAVYLNGSGNTLRLQSGAISTDGRESVALFVKGDAQPENYASNAVQLRGGSVSASGESAQAILAYGSANFITVNGGAVRAEGDYVYGVALNPVSEADEGGSQFTMTKGSVTVSGSRAIAIYSEGPAAGKANSISIMEYGTTTVSAIGTRANAIIAQNYNEVEISGGTISAENNALTANQKDATVVCGGTLSGAVGVNVACGSGGSVQFKENWDGSTPTVQGSTAAVKAQYTWRGRSDDTAMIQITAGRFDGAITSDATKTGNDQDAYTYYDITGGSFSEVIEDSAYYNFAVSKGLTPGEYDKAKETNALEQREDGRYYIVEASQSGYVLMNIPYADFYAGEGIEGVDGVSSATKNKPRTGTLAGGSYHVNADGSDISGVIYPVFVKDMTVLADCTKITDASSVDITVTNRGKETTTTYSGKDALFESANYSYYVLSEAPARYKTLTVDEAGVFCFSAVSGSAVTVEGASGAVNEAGHHADVEIKLADTTGIAQGQAVSGVIVTFDDGTKIALRHIANIWRATELGGSMAEFAGKTITNVRYYTQDDVIDFPMTIEVKKAPGELAASFTKATELQLTGLPEDIENATATVQTKVGRGETPVVIAENIPVVDGIVTVSEAVPDTVYTVTVSSANYLPMSAEAQYEQPPCDGGENCPSKKFKDVDQTQWYHEAVDYAVVNGLYLGTSENTFEPDTAMTRGMFVTVLHRMEGTPAPKAESKFIDLTQDWYKDAVAWAAENGIVMGTSETTFAPNEKITREQAATMLMRYAAFKGVDVSKTVDLSKFGDAASISGWADAAVRWAVAEELIQGMPGNLLQPQGDSTRAQIATILMRFQQNLK